MEIKIRGACENNLKNVDIDIGDGLTVVTGISGSGKTSLVFDTMYHEARRRFLEVFNSGRSRIRMPPAHVRSVTGIGPTIAVGQNLLNRNPGSTLASASGLHPFLRLLFARYGVRKCHVCGTGLSQYSEDEIVSLVLSAAKNYEVSLASTVVQGAKGSHRTLIAFLEAEFGKKNVLVDGMSVGSTKVEPTKEHRIQVVLGKFNGATTAQEIRAAVQTARLIGADSVTVIGRAAQSTLSMTNVCSECGTWFGELESKHFNLKCIHCGGQGCDKCSYTGLHHAASSVLWKGLTFPQLLQLTVDDARKRFDDSGLPESANRLVTEITRRLDALLKVGLGYIHLNRSSPSLSRGESQRVRLAVSLTSRLEDIVHVIDEPTIGQSPADVSRLLPSFRELLGPVVFVEHDRVAAAEADWAIDIGPGAGDQGGEIVFEGTPSQLWKSNTTTGEYFSLRKQVPVVEPRPTPSEFITIHSAFQHNLKNIDVKIPLECLTVISGVSGSGKSTLVEHVLVPSLEQKTPAGCKMVSGKHLKPVLVDQSPIGKNPRSNPGTYTKLSDIIRDFYAQETGLSASHFSFNRPEGACPTCQGMSALEVKMRYLPSIWITCSTCEGQRFSDEVLAAKVAFGDQELSIADFYNLSISEIHRLISQEDRLNGSKKSSAIRILDALVTVGLGYLKLGQSSPSLSGGESQRVKLAKYLGKKGLSDKLLVLDEPSTGLHPSDLLGLIKVLDKLVRAGATIVLVEHNTDMIRSADWVVDLGPEAGPVGGEIVYSGDLEGLYNATESLTAKALISEEFVKPKKTAKKPKKLSDSISITNATANNLQSVCVKIPKSKLVVVTGVSGSGKSSLVRDVLQAEADRRYLESLSVYERQGTKEGPEASVESVSGLGVSISITSRRGSGPSYYAVYETRSKVGTVTEISNQINSFFATLAKRRCLDCGTLMKRTEQWICPKCGTTAPLPSPRDFSPRTYSAACGTCSGVGHINHPAPEKLIIAPDKPICGGAMYSPGYYPGKYFCEPTSAAAGILVALGGKYEFDPKTTPWNEISPKAQDAFLYGDKESLEFSYLGTQRGKRIRVTGKQAWRGFYGFVNDWDIGQTFSTRKVCEMCKGTGLKEDFLAFSLAGYNVDELQRMTISRLREVLNPLDVPESDPFYARENHFKAVKRLEFLEKVGLGYLHLNRSTVTLSAGEAQRIVLAGLLGSGLTSLTILLDEPTRGMHPSEVNSLVKALKELRDEGNSVIIVEHDPVIIRAADELIDMGPSSGTRGGKIVARGPLTEIISKNTITAQWISGKRRVAIPKTRRESIAWMNIEGAKGNNLKNLNVEIPLGVLVGFCGVSGSGKSTLLVDTLGRAIAPKRFTTSVAYEDIEPEEYDSIRGTPERVVMLDQAKKGIRYPGNALDIMKDLVSIYAESEDAHALGIEEDLFSKSCSVCKGAGRIRTELGFLPNVYSECETCNGSGRTAEAWDVRVKGYALPELNNLTLGEIYDLFKDDERIERKVRPALDVGLEYLVLRQPSITLSGGEVQRLKIAQELAKKSKQGALFIIDEPSVGQHLEDVDRLIDVLHRLVADGNSVFVIEHHPHILAACDWIIELGPKGGPDGGYVIAEGTPEDLAKLDTPTATYIKEVLEGGL